MSVITISRGSYCRGKEIAEGIAQRLRYECISREALLENSEEFNIPGIKLVQAVEDAPSLLDRLTFGTEKYLAYIQKALLDHLKKDNTVYHGFSCPVFLKGISHVLRVRIIAETEDRIGLVMERDKVSKDEASRFLKKIDGARKKWSRKIYGIDPTDPNLYDLVLHIHRISVFDAVDVIESLVRLEKFQTTPESRSAMDDLALAAEVKTMLLGVKRDIEVCVENGIIYIQTPEPMSQGVDLLEKMEEVLKTIPRVKEFRILVGKQSPDRNIYPYRHCTRFSGDATPTYFGELG
jgi:cytidylate kinase